MSRLSRQPPVRVLLYGFGPYRNFTENITRKIIESLPSRQGLGRIIFPVRFQHRQFVEALARPRPLMIVGLGQSSRPRIEVETRAINHRRANKNSVLRPITAGGSEWLPATMPLFVTRPAAKSINAGDYVCNYSMYVMLEELESQNHDGFFGFVHIPHNYDLNEACRYVDQVVDECFNLADKLERDRAAKKLGS